MLEPKESQNGTIKRIAKDVSRKISTSQVVISLGSACKELIDNGLDAGATNIDIRVKNFGYELLEVSDNGVGIKSDDFDELCMVYQSKIDNNSKPHATSKLNQISDFSSLSTFGFRGEALNALCALSCVSITTRHKSEEVGNRLSFDRNGEIIGREKCAWPVGTMVAVKNLFEPLPVRRKEFERTSRKEFNKLLIAVQSFAFSRTDVRFSVSSFANGKRHQVLLSPGGDASITDVIVSLFGARAEKGAVLKIIQAEPDETVASLYSVSPTAKYDDIRLSGYISSCEHGHGRSSNDRQFIYFNKRPVTYPKLCRVANEVYQQYNSGQYCMLILFVEIPADLIDVNVSPDKQTVYFEREKDLLALLRSSLLATFVPLFGKTESLPTNKAWEKEKQSEQGRSEPQAQSQNPEADASVDVAGASLSSSLCDTSDQSLSNPIISKGNAAIVRYLADVNSQPLEICRKRRADEDQGTLEQANVKRGNCAKLEQFAFKIIPHIPSDIPSTSKSAEEFSVSGLAGSVSDVIKRRDYEECGKNSGITLSKIVGQATRSDLILPTDRDDDFMGGDTESVISHQSTPMRPLSRDACIKPGVTEGDIANERVFANGDDNNCQGGKMRTQQKINFSMADLKQRIQELCNRTMTEEDEDEEKSAVQRASFVAVDQKLAENELSAYISKDDFERMEVIGQFNKGFIITRLRGDLFIIDQHASDEKFNFERFQKKARIQSQALLRPLSLGLGAFEESLLRDHLEIFNYNGFEFQINEDGEPGHRVFVTSIPVLHNWQFNTSDIDEMLSVLREFPGTMYRPTKLRKLFALRACRKSVMIGTALSVSKMEKIVRHLNELDHPWNCPHGRPTLRHLCALDVQQSEENAALKAATDAEARDDFRDDGATAAASSNEKTSRDSF